MSKYNIGQEVWYVNRNYSERGYGVKLSEEEPFKASKRKIVNIRMYGNPIGPEGETPHIRVRYTIAKEAGEEPSYNPLQGFHSDEREFKEEHLYDTEKEAIIEIVKLIDERMSELREIKTVYMKKIDETKRTDTVEECNKEWETVAGEIGDLFDELQPL